MKFVDQCNVKVIAGDGGNGSVAFRREKYIPFGGPAGGDGGRGGDVVFIVDPGRSTLLDLAHVRFLRAKHGQHGMGADCYGKGGESLEIRVPPGTQVFDKETGELLFDLNAEGSSVIVAHGGRGGRGNIHFATAEDRAPKRAEEGHKGQERDLRLELKVMADVGLLGFPNVGKSTFVSACSRARTKVADYPFTTLVPQLGVVRIDDQTAFVVADIPGLIPGAAQGAGLGIRFLKHVERTRALLHLITVTGDEEGRDPVKDYRVLLNELKQFDPELAKRPTLVAMSKADLPHARDAFEKASKSFAKMGIKLRLISAATGEGMKEILKDLARLVAGDDRVLEAPLAKDGAKNPAKKKLVSTRVKEAPSRKPKPKKKGAKKVAPTPAGKLKTKKELIANARAKGSGLSKSKPKPKTKPVGNKKPKRGTKKR